MFAGWCFFALSKTKVMKQNMGNLDRVLRIIAALAIAALYFTNIISGVVATVGLVIAGIFVLTSFVSFCPLYLPLGINTREKKK
jgi:Protein of unknown function (DUF2892)